VVKLNQGSKGNHGELDVDVDLMQDLYSEQSGVKPIGAPEV